MKCGILILLRLFHVLFSMSNLVAFCMSSSLVTVRFGFGEQLFHGGSSTHLGDWKVASDVCRPSLVDEFIDERTEIFTAID